MEVANGDFILIGIITVIVWMCLYDSDWKRKVFHRYDLWKYTRECSPEELRRIREEQADRDIRDRLQKRKKQAQEELRALKQYHQQQLRKEVWRSQQKNLWEKEQRG